MKCPRCRYLGFETGDRCKNCGYDFSLLRAAPPADPDPTIRPTGAACPDPSAWPVQADEALGAVAVHGARASELAVDELHIRHAEVQQQPAVPADPLVGAGAARRAPGREAAAPASRAPVFRRAGRGRQKLPGLDTADDEPLVRLPHAPRAPLSVRRTPQTARSRSGRSVAGVRPAGPSGPARAAALAPAVDQPPTTATASGPRPVSIGPGRRLVAATLDGAILLAVDAVVVAFTLRMAQVPLAEWRVLPVLPLAGFLMLLKLAYVGLFTALGGQTIGKMAVGIRVVSDGGGSLDPGRAARRTLAGLVSVATLGAGFLPALFGPDHRALHDRVARTRVVAWPS